MMWTVDMITRNSDVSNRGYVGLPVGQQTMVKVPTQPEFREGWSESIILFLSLVDDGILYFGRPLSQLLEWDRESSVWVIR